MSSKGFGVLALVCCIGINGCDQKAIEEVKRLSQTPKEQAMAMLSHPVSDISPAKLCPIFEFGSDYTDLQRERVVADIKGKYVEWRLQVYEVKSTDKADVYRIQTQSCTPQSASPQLNKIEQEAMSALRQLGGDFGALLGNTLEVNRNVPTFIDLVLMNDSDRQRIYALKTNDWIVIRGRITGTFMRNIEIEPAVFSDALKQN